MRFSSMWQRQAMVESLTWKKCIIDVFAGKCRHSAFWPLMCLCIHRLTILCRRSLLSFSKLILSAQPCHPILVYICMYLYVCMCVWACLLVPFVWLVCLLILPLFWRNVTFLLEHEIDIHNTVHLPISPSIKVLKKTLLLLANRCKKK